jgi:putative ABC transport system permease protein
MGQVAASTPIPDAFFAVFPLILVTALAGAGIAIALAGAWLPATWAARARIASMLAAK